MLTADPILFTFTVWGKTIAVTGWTLFGLLMGNALFTSRVLVQWVLSEKRGRSVTPPAYWWLSLVATLAMIAYGFQRRKVEFIVAYIINMLPYVRNLVLCYRPTKGAGPIRLALCAAAVLLALVVLISVRQAELVQGAWFYVGFAGAMLFSSRFLIQWLHSERLGRSELPLTFWCISLAGSTVLLVCSVHDGDLVYILSFLFNGIPYVRNIMLIGRERRASAAGEEEGG